MKFKVSAGCFKCKIFKNPTRKLTQMLKKFKLKKSLCIRPLCFRPSQPKPNSTNNNSNSSSPARKKKLINRLKSVLFCSNRGRQQSVDMDRLMKLKSFSDSGQQQKAPNSSPITPAYVRTSAAAAACLRSEVNSPVVVVAEDACRSFESYLVEMIVEEGKLNDLMDVEELLYCWMNLKCPIFKELVCRFYGDLCKDLFSNNNN
ncbi:transcription repressor OFP17-like [Impatiens glandulifera]|uniref:transcription repressor OFP17-like n=1 Tax=Impatiens glandulifera TaxID=253017 RepID=UPI001FB1916E|nr:transcription repressor OFP17-like [Impatiens glandulifera]